MSDAPKPVPADAKPSAGPTPGGQQPTTVKPAPLPGNPAAGAVPPQPAGPIEYAMPAPKKSWLLNPNAIRNLGCLFKLCVAFTVLILMGYFALVALNPKAREWATKGAKDGTGGPTPFKVMNQILAIPAQAIGKTKDVVAAGDARAGMLDGVIADSEGKGKKGGGSAAAVAAQPVVDPFAAPSAAAAKPGISAARAAGAASVTGDAAADDPGVSRSALLAMAEQQGSAPDDAAAALAVAPKDPPAPPEMKLAGGIVISSASPAGGPVVHASFFYWVVNLNISGVFQSAPHRVMMDKRLVYEGQEANSALGITFDHLDLANKLIVFRDKTGALVTRSY